MEESVGAQYAIQIAVHTLKDRCKTLQQRLQLLEQENVILRSKCVYNEETDLSCTEIGKLKKHLAEVTEQKDHLHERVKMVTSENQELWTKLGKLIKVNNSLNEQFQKINETLNQHTSPPTLLRSKTFTQNNPVIKHSSQKNLEVNENLSMELENISLKLTDNFSKQKIELEKMCTEIESIQCADDDIITDSFGFNFEKNVEDEVYDEINYVLDSLKQLKEEVLLQRNVLHKSVKQMECLSAKKIICKKCDKRKKIKIEQTTSTDDIPRIGVDKSTETHNLVEEERQSPLTQSLPIDVEKICPICSKHFRKEVKFEEFQQHVENHFNIDVSSFELL